MRMRKRGIAVMLAVASMAAPAMAAENPETESGVVVKEEPQLPPLDVRYDVEWGGIGIGQMEVQLKSDAAAGADCYTYSAISHPSGLARSLYGSPNQASQFCLVQGQVRSRHFNSVLPGDEQQSYTLEFDWNKLTATDENGQVRTIPAGTVDSFALQQAVRLWVQAHAADANPPVAEFDMVDRKNLTHYRFRLAGHESVRTHAGTFDTLVLERIDNPKKEGHFWLAAEHGYMPVKIQTRSGSKPAVTFALASFAQKAK